MTPLSGWNFYRSTPKLFHDLGGLGVLLSYKVTRGIILVVGRVTEMVFGNLEGQRGVNGGQRWSAWSL